MGRWENGDPWQVYCKAGHRISTLTIKELTGSL
jgi:hypothetical protein